MNTTNMRAPAKSILSYGICALLALGAATAQVAGAAGTAGATGIDASGSYQQEVNACMTGKTQQDQATCLKEARNAQADKQRGVLNTSGSPQSNASARCEVLAGEDKAACQARMMGYGSTEGTVAGGGVIREVETVVLPAGASSVTIQPQTNSEPVVLVPTNK
ncbi:hypothetical protein [Ramlibacter sp.]|uniref:hypothetical protein n=1 Tax=Ramlibacter sp. TaxID=1917967 RepID=UPI0017E86E3F|nr:hypothetical protein [Ramlibacter sp.]MBA2675700.1 hypothetical protein [Ramlibacter sp.]